MDVIESEEFAELALDKNVNSFVFYARQVLNANEPFVYRNRRDRIVQTRSVAGTVELPPEYNEYFDVFSDSGAAELPKHGPADHAIDLIDGKQPRQRLHQAIYIAGEIIDPICSKTRRGLAALQVPSSSRWGIHSSTRHGQKVHPVGSHCCIS